MAAPQCFPDLDAAKRAARERAKQARIGLDPLSAGMTLADNVLRDAPPPPGAIIAGFWPIADEIDVRPLLHILHDRGHAIVLPITPKRGNPLSFGRWQPGDPLVTERFGTVRPTGDAMVPTFLLVPLLAFDRRCHRLGYGAGYYDRTLAALPPHIAVGCAFAAQFMDEVPVGPHDVRLHAVATETGVMFCKDD